jgi:pantetheine-phosphate adenylyltransferase
VPVAIYAGTFDPVTNGHLDIIRRGAALFGHLVIGVGARIDKKTLFGDEERVALLKEVTRDIEGVKAVESFEGLVVDFAKKQGATVLVRGLRNSTDYEYENQMAVTNATLAPGTETVFLAADREVAFISSTLIREILKAGGDVGDFVPECVAVALRAKSG